MFLQSNGNWTLSYTSLSSSKDLDKSGENSELAVYLFIFMFIDGRIVTLPMSENKSLNS